MRRACLARREALAGTRRAVLEAAITQHLQQVFAEHPPGVLAFCWPIRGEFDARPLMQALRAGGWQTCLPWVETLHAPMRFRAWSPGVEMMADRHGIPYPAGGPCLVPDVILLPLVAFDPDNYRLGYGGGYFDRTLVALDPPPLTVGAGFELSRVATIGPKSHDIPLDLIVTEQGIFPPRHSFP
ncbi:MAG: 5-formyltetrahydrofolate cyclo-ligase [Proteobacteria bacterium]|nr:5-formyltetrahydrofolate cyclo-ligase [Pseudomonadota bacterium]